MNRTALGLAVGAGYLLGRTRKMKLALAIGAMAAGKKLPLSPDALKDVLTQQVENNPALKELGTQLRGDLRDAGKAASGALVERQMTGLADRLADRTRAVRDRMAGAEDEAPRDGAAEDAGGAEDAGARERETAQDAEEESGRGAAASGAERARRPAKAAQRSAARGAARATGTAGKAAPAKRTPQKKTAAKRTTGRKPAAAAKPAAGKTATSSGGATRGAARRGTGGRSGEGRR